MGLNFSYLGTQLNDEWMNNSSTEFYDKNGDVESVLDIDQINDNVADKQLFKANALYVEPLSKKFFFQTFYNFRNRNESGNRTVEDVENDQKALNENLSREYDNNIKYNRAGASLRYSHNGMNISGGLAYEHFLLDGSYASKGQNGISGTVDKTFTNLIPNVSINFQPWRNAYASISYNRNAQEPEISDLQPLVDNINPLYIREGNSSLTPALGDEFSVYINRSFPLSGVRASINLTYTTYSNQFSTEETVNDRLVTTVKPINIEGGNRSSAWLSFSFPFVKNKFTTRLGLNLNSNQRPAIVNGLNNNTASFSYSPSIRFNITPSKDVSLYINGRINNSRTSYDLNTSQDQNTRTTTIGLEGNTKLLAGFYVSSNLDYVKYTNDRFSLDRTVPVWNASIYKRLLPENRAELRLSFYDILDKNIGFFQGTYGLGVSQTETPTLARYTMLTLTYNIRGIKSDVRKKSWW